MYDLEHDGDGRNDLYQLLSHFQEMRGRQSALSHPGAPERDRTRGRSDKPKGASKPKTSKHKKQGSKDKSTSKSKRPRDEVEAPASQAKKKIGSSKVVQEKIGYKGDDAILHLKRYGAQKGWILECYPTTAGLQKQERWFMRVENGSKTTDSKGNICIQGCVWMMANSVTALFDQKEAPCDIMSVVACGPPNFFGDVGKPKKPITCSTPSSSKPAPTPKLPLKRALPLWVPMPTYNYSAQQFIHQKMSKSVDHVEFPVLHAAVKTALVPGAFDAANKHSLIELMCKYNCEFVANPHPMVRLANNQSSSQLAAVPATATAAVSAASSSDEDAPLAAKYADAYFVDKARESVKGVNVSALRAAMILVPGVSTCKSKDELIRLMVEQKFNYDVLTIVSD